MSASTRFFYSQISFCFDCLLIIPVITHALFSDPLKFSVSTFLWFETLVNFLSLLCYMGCG